MNGAPAGFVVVDEFLSAGEEQDLLRLLEPMELFEVRMHGVVARRTTRHFGYDYAYESRRVAPTEPIPPELEWVRTRAGELAGVAPEALVELLVTKYPPGASIGWHRDAPMFGSKVIGVSLLSACRMRFRRTGRDGSVERFVAELPPRSAYVIGGSARWQWQHHIPATRQTRYSLTFRSLRAGV